MRGHLWGELGKSGGSRMCHLAVMGRKLSYCRELGILGSPPLWSQASYFPSCLRLQLMRLRKGQNLSLFLLSTSCFWPQSTGTVGRIAGGLGGGACSWPFTGRAVGWAHAPLCPRLVCSGCVHRVTQDHSWFWFGKFCGCELSCRQTLFPTPDPCSLSPCKDASKRLCIHGEG